MFADPRREPFDYPPEWAHRAGSLVGVTTLKVAGYDVQMRMTFEALNRVYLPLLSLLAARATGPRRVLAGLAGIPGSGKSTFAAAMALLADRVWPPGRLAVVGMDGWHYPNAVLNRLTVADENGRPIPLRQRKGGPQSFDVAALAGAIRSLRAADRVVNLPAYDRRLHDPVPGAVAIDARTRIVLIEGNFVLSTAHPWDKVSSLLKPRLFLEADPAVARERIMDRHIRGGASPEQAREKFETNDRLNIAVAAETAANADFIIGLEPRPCIRAQAPPDAESP